METSKKKSHTEESDSMESDDEWICANTAKEIIIDDDENTYVYNKSSLC